MPRIFSCHFSRKTFFDTLLERVSRNPSQSLLLGINQKLPFCSRPSAFGLHSGNFWNTLRSSSNGWMRGTNSNGGLGRKHAPAPMLVLGRHSEQPLRHPELVSGSPTGAGFEQLAPQRQFYWLITFGLQGLVWGHETSTAHV